MNIKLKKSAASILLLLVLAFQVYCETGNASEIYINDALVKDSGEVVMYVQNLDVETAELGDLLNSRSLKLYGKMTFANGNKQLDKMMNQKERFNVTYLTDKDGYRNELVFLDCLMDGKYTKKKFIVYRFIARDIR